MPRTKRILPEFGSMKGDKKKVLVEKDTNTSKDEDTVTPQAKKAKIDEHGENAEEATASSFKKKGAGKTTKASGKKDAAAMEKATAAATEKTKAAGAKAAADMEKATAAGKKAADKATAVGKKAAAATEKATKKPQMPEKLKNPKLCVSLCLPGPKSGCCQRSGKRLPGQLKCTEVYKLLEDLGVEDCSIVSRCMMAGLMAGHIKLPEGGDLDTVLYEFKGLDECDHWFKVTLKKLLYQPDYAGLDCMDGLHNATVFCEDACEDGRAYVTFLCEGKPELNSGKAHNHCYGCPGFGKCLLDYREECRINKKTGYHHKPRFIGSGGWLASDNEGDSDEGGQEWLNLLR